MDLSALLLSIRRLEGYQSLLRSLRDGGGFSVVLPLPRSARSAVAAALVMDLKRPLLYVTAKPDRALTLVQEFGAWSPDLELLPFLDPDPLFYERSPWGERTRHRRAGALARLVDGMGEGAAEGDSPFLVLTSARALITRTLSPRQFNAQGYRLAPGQKQNLGALIADLVGMGYQPSGIVTTAGEYSRRGGILDLWPPKYSLPLRLEFFGDEIESMRHFEPSTQRSTHSCETVAIAPAREGLPRLFDTAWEKWIPPTDADPIAWQQSLLETFLPWMNRTPHGLLDYLPGNAVVTLDDRGALEESIHDVESQALQSRSQQIEAKAIPPDSPIPYLTRDAIDESLGALATIDFGMLSGVEGEGEGWPFEPGQRFGGQLQPVLDHLLQRRISHEAVVVVSRQAKRLAELWSEVDNPASVLEAIPADLVPGEIVFLQGALSEGWTLRDSTGIITHLITDAEIFGWSQMRPRRRSRPRATAPESAYADLGLGDFVVHVDYGVGRFEGLVLRTLEGMPREYLLVSYADGGQIYVPIHQAERLTRYVGVGGAAPKLSRLGTQEWERVKGRASHAIEEIAKDLLDLYARRMMVSGHAYSADTAWQQELEASFAYTETEDQHKALQAVKTDMERPRPMDRLICGDVGYGKTEVALRAAFKAVMDGRQVAMLVPTTILAQQHFQTFTQRLLPFPIEVEMLSRFRTHAEAADILKRLASGRIDIVIGTHRLLQKDVRFREIGLLIIDEEQRFGVTHKEHLKQMRTEVDVLTLTATPIPRTLYMALTGVRDISTIDTPPEHRLSVVTHSGPYDPPLIRQAILRELERGGQAFFVHNRVQTISRMKERLERLVPEAGIGVAHGQMPERDLARIMNAFGAGEIDVLLSTSIIESGLDYPNANTLIVDRADRFGLAQLYQLRGRVGRGTVRAYAYFFYKSRRQATEEALLRLETITEHSQLGAGYSLALQDLEMRGAGDILGKRQHGHIAAIGFHFYTQLLSTAVRRLRTQRREVELPLADLAPLSQIPLSVSVELALASAITPEYVADRDLRLQLYRRLANLRSLSEVSAIEAELVDRFGPPPEEVRNLLFQLTVKIMAASAMVNGVSSENGQILIQLSPDRVPSDLGENGFQVRVSKRGIWLSSRANEDWKQQLLDLLEHLAGQI